MNVLRISQLWVYPIKSFGGIGLTRARLKQKGFEYDRRWMLISEDGTFMTQRKTPALALFKCSFRGSELAIAYDGDIQYIPLEPDSGDTVRATLWRDVVSVTRVNPTVDEWFSRKLGYPCSLVHFPEEGERLVDADYREGDERVSLADGYPYLIIGEESLNELNRRLKDPVPMNRFRPNLVFSGGMPFEEDTWKSFRIGENKFRGVKPCSRCILPTIDQDTGISGQEPLKTLSSFRTKEHKVLFGQNAIASTLGQVNLGDSIEVSVYQNQD